MVSVLHAPPRRTACQRRIRRPQPFRGTLISTQRRRGAEKFSTRGHGQPSPSLAASRPTHENARTKIQEARYPLAFLYFPFLCSRGAHSARRRRLPRSHLRSPLRNAFPRASQCLRVSVMRQEGGLFERISLRLCVSASRRARSGLRICRRPV